MGEVCGHQNQISDVSRDSEGCEDCLKSGDGWVHLRRCLICGYSGCCDSSKNRHARGHWEQTGHPLIQSVEPGESWRWCYIDEIFFR